MTPSNPAPPTLDRFRSDDPDEVTERIARLDGSHSRVVHGRGPYGYTAEVLRSGPVAVARAASALGNTLHGTARVATVQIAAGARSRYLYGRRSFEVAPDTPVFVAAGTAFTRRSDACAILAIDVAEDTMRTELAGRRGGVAPAWVLVPHALPQAMAPALRAAATGLAAAQAPAQRRQWEAELIERIADAVLATDAARAAGGIAARRLADLEAWIDAHLTERITLGRLCAQAGVADRTLHLAFQARRGTSPLRFVHERRLAAAHLRLTQADAAAEVTTIAADLGFTHLGRFAQSYRQLFGEAPSATLRRRRARR